MREALADYPGGLPEEVDLSNDDWLLETLRCWDECERQHAFNHFVRIKSYVQGYGLYCCESHEEYFSTHESQAFQSVRAMLNIAYHCKAFRDRILPQMLCILPQMLYLNLVFCVAPKDTKLSKVDSFIQLTNLFKRLDQRTIVLVKGIYVASVETLTPVGDGSGRYKELEPFHTFYTHCDFGMVFPILTNRLEAAKAVSSYTLASPFSTYSKPNHVQSPRSSSYSRTTASQYSSYAPPPQYSHQPPHTQPLSYAGQYPYSAPPPHQSPYQPFGPAPQVSYAVPPPPDATPPTYTPDLALPCITNITILLPPLLRLARRISDNTMHYLQARIEVKEVRHKALAEINALLERISLSLHHQHNNTTSSTSAADSSHIRQHMALSSSE